MKKTINSFLFIIALFFTACGDNTKNPVVTDIASVQIDNGDISIYSTDAPLSLSATVIYDDGSSKSIDDANLWSNSNYDVLSMYGGTISVLENGGSSIVGINIGRFSDEINVTIIKINDFNITNDDINSTGEHILEATGLFEDNSTKIISKNILWGATNGATITTDENYIATIDILSGDTNVTATVFVDDNETNITKSVIYSID